MTFKELREKADLLNQNPSLSSTNSFLVQLCRELDGRFGGKRVGTTNVAPIEENVPVATEEPVTVKKKRGKKKK